MVKDGKYICVGTEAGKNADFPVFDDELLTAEHEGFPSIILREVYFCGKKVN